MYVLNIHCWYEFAIFSWNCFFASIINRRQNCSGFFLFHELKSLEIVPFSTLHWKMIFARKHQHYDTRPKKITFLFIRRHSTERLPRDCRERAKRQSFSWMKNQNTRIFTLKLLYVEQKKNTKIIYKVFIFANSSLIVFWLFNVITSPSILARIWSLKWKILTKVQKKFTKDFNYFFVWGYLKQQIQM